MRTLMSGTLVLLLSAACSAQTQNQTETPETPARQDGGVRAVLESIVIPPIPNQPFTATLQTEWIQYTGEGGTITLVNERPLARDSKGRVYQERWILVPKFGKVKSQKAWVQIADPKLHTLYSCTPFRHICELETYDPTHELAAAEPRKPIPNGTIVQDHLTIEDLGTKRIAGVDTVGRRETYSIDVGVMGNDQPLTSLNETWHSQELAINLFSIRKGPEFGKQTFIITDLSAVEPDPELFKVPEKYEIRDLRKNPPISW
ncbi:MAG TPA: hypothetical protein VMP68_16875 [Candidatus Eisenbacteria bacterium]|nr:hypothetical protein [Candidatus Eisenbacteria bacterium]